jgi:hypothetical protein
MTTIHEVKQVLKVNTPFGVAQVLFLMDYGIHQNTIWVCSSLADGKIRHFDSNQISLVTNHTIDMNVNKNKNGK